MRDNYPTNNTPGAPWLQARWHSCEMIDLVPIRLQSQILQWIRANTYRHFRTRGGTNLVPLDHFKATTKVPGRIYSMEKPLSNSILTSLRFSDRHTTKISI